MTEPNTEQATPPYASWKTFLRFLEQLADKGVPQQIDRTVMAKMSGATQSNIRVTLTFLNLTDCDGEPSDTLRALVASHGKGDEWKSALRGVITEAYGPLIGDLSLETGTADQLWKCFRENGGVRGSTLSRAVRFYLAGLREAGVTYSSYFKAPPPPPRSKAKRSPEPEKGTEDSSSAPGRKAGGELGDSAGDEDRPRSPRNERPERDWRTHSFNLPNYKAPVEVRAPLKITIDEWDLISQFMTGTIKLANLKSSPPDRSEDED